MRVFLQTLGCRLNEAEVEIWSRDCRARGFALTDRADDADLVIVNTCAVTGESVRKSRQLVRRAQRANPQARLVVTGCYASLAPETPAASDLGVDLLIPNRDKDRLIEIATERLHLPTTSAHADEHDREALLPRGRHRAFIKVQDGCRYRCSFCIVTRARGAERSRPATAVLDEVRALEGAGVREIVLAGVHLGGYGSDIGSGLTELLGRLLGETAVPRIRLGSLEPWELHDGFWELFDDPRLMPHLHLPVQSGADSVLRRMSRRGRVDDFRRLVDRARTRIADCNVTTDIIVGFPGETEAEWRQTLAFAEEMQFGHIHVFAYSPRSGTRAAALPGQLSREVKRERSRQLHEVAEAGRRAALARAVGRRFEVLIEGREAADDDSRVRWTGYTPNYLRAALHADPDDDLDNVVLPVLATGIADDGVHLGVSPAGGAR